MCPVFVFGTDSESLHSYLHLIYIRRVLFFPAAFSFVTEMLNIEKHYDLLSGFSRIL